MAAIPDYVGNALQFDRSQRDTERVQDAQIQNYLYQLTQQKQQDQIARQGQTALLKALSPDATIPAAIPPPPPSDSGAGSPAGGAMTSPYMSTPPVQAQPMPTPPPGQSSQPMQPPGAAGAPPNLASLLGPKGQSYLSQQPQNAQPAALQVLLANLMGKGATARAPAPPGAGPAPAAPMQGPAPAGGPAPTPNAATGGWSPSPTASQALGGKPPMAGAAPGGNEIGAPPTLPNGQSIDPAKMPSIPQLIAKMEKAGVDPQAQFAALQAYTKIEDTESKKALEFARVKAEIARAGAEASRAKAEELRAQAAAGGKATKPTSFEQEAGDLYGVGSPEYKKVLGDRVKRDSAPTSSMISGAPGATGLSSGAVDLAASQYLATGQMPPLGFSSQALRTAILNRAAELQQQTGETTEEVPGKRAEFKANQTALTQITKDLTAIAPFQEMLSKNSDILKTLAGNVVKTDNQLANRSINWLQNNMLGNSNVAEYLAQVQIVQTEAARVLNNPRLVGQLTDSARHEMQNIVSGNMSLGQTVAVVDRLQSDANNRVNAMRKQSEQLRKSLGSPTSGSTTNAASPPVNSKGWKLMTDKNGNRAYVSPDKKQFEAVQ